MTAMSRSEAGGGLLAMIEERIRMTAGNRVMGLRVEPQGAGVRLCGRVATRHAKQIVLHAALEFLDGADLCDQVEVCC